MRPFKPHPWLVGGQIQTISGQFLPGASPRPHKVPLPVNLDDGDQLLHYFDGPDVHQTPQKLVVLLMHGLGGSSESSYVLRLSAKLNALGYPVVRFNHRSATREGESLAKGIYHAGRVDDLDSTLATMAVTFSGYNVAIASFSLSGNLMLRYLGERSSKATRLGVVSAIAVCPPVNLELCSQALCEKRNWLIDRYYTRRLISTAEKRRQRLGDPNPIAWPRQMNLRVFDEVYTSPLAGFSSREHYYATCSSFPVLDQINIDTTILAAADDPIIPEVSFENAARSPHVKLLMERHGGHMGFIAHQKTRFGDRRWMDQFVVDWVLKSTNP